MAELCASVDQNEILSTATTTKDSSGTVLLRHPAGKADEQPLGTPSSRNTRVRAQA